MEFKRFFISWLVFSLAMFLLFGVSDVIIFDVLWVFICIKLDLDKICKKVNPLYAT